MSKSLLARSVALAALGTSLALPAVSQAAFLEDSKASLEMRNFYMNRDFREDGGKIGSGQSKADEWAQGFILRVESGFTEGTVGFGLDAIGNLGLRLDSGNERTGTGILQTDKSGGGEDNYGDFGATAKMRVSKSTLKVGTLMPKLPAVQYNDSRLLPQTFQGGWLNSAEIDGLTVDLGQLNRVNQRDSSDNEVMTLNGAIAPGKNPNGRGIVTKGGAVNESDEFNFAGLSYKWNDQLTTTYNYGELEDLYKQHILNVVHVLPIADGQSLKTDLRYARSTDDGDSNVDNKAFGAMLTYNLGGHAFGLGYQKMSGDTGYAYIGGTDPFLVNFVQIGDFAFKDEKSYQLRYDYNFAALGIPGLTFMTRYLNGDNVDLGVGQREGKEWERDTDIAYVFQEGPLKNFGVKWRNATVRSNFGDDLDENRLILSYMLPLW